MIVEEEDEWRENMEQEISVGHNAYLEIAPDFYPKDNVSGGMPYSIEITKYPSFDSELLFYSKKIKFIEYLRECFESGGFPGVTFKDPREKDIISKLKTGLMPI